MLPAKARVEAMVLDKVRARVTAMIPDKGKALALVAEGAEIKVVLMAQVDFVFAQSVAKRSRIRGD